MTKVTAGVAIAVVVVVSNWRGRAWAIHVLCGVKSRYVPSARLSMRPWVLLPVSFRRILATKAIRRVGAERSDSERYFRRKPKVCTQSLRLSKRPTSTHVKGKASVSGRLSVWIHIGHWARLFRIVKLGRKCRSSLELDTELNR